MSKEVVKVEDGSFDGYKIFYTQSFGLVVKDITPNPPSKEATQKFLDFLDALKWF